MMATLGKAFFYCETGFFPERGVDAGPQTGGRPAGKSIVNRGTGREFPGQHAPLATCFIEVAQSVESEAGAFRGFFRACPEHRLGREEKGAEKRPFLISEVRRVNLVHRGFYHVFENFN